MAEDRQPTREPGEISLRGVAWGGAVIAAGIALAVILSYLLWQRGGEPSGALPFGGPNTGNLPANLPAVTAPVLQSGPQDERARYFAEKQKLLESWGWIDRSAGIARIPLDEAMRIMAGRGNQAATAPKEGQ